MRGFASLVRAPEVRQWNDGGNGPWFSPFGVDGSPVVTAEGAFNLSAVWACETLIADNIATLPVDTYRKAAGVRTEVDPPYWIEQPNPEMDRVDYDTQRIFSLLGWGDAVSLVVREGGASSPAAKVLERWVVDPDRVVIRRDAQRHLAYYIDGMYVPTGNIQHVRGYVLPGCVEGMSVVARARQSFGIGLSAEQTGSRLMENGIAPSGVLSVPALPAEATKDVVERLRESFSERYAGSGNAGKPVVLTGGTTWSQLTLNPVDAQFLETRKFQKEEICSWFRVPPHKIQVITNNASQGGGNGLEQMDTEYSRDTLLSWTRRLERADSKLLDPSGRSYVRYNLDAYVRTDLKTRMEAHEIAIRAGMATPDNRLMLEDSEPVAGGDKIRLPLQTTLVDESTAQFDPGVVNSIGGLVRAGFEPAAILAAFGLPNIKHTGALPVTIQAEEDTNPVVSTPVGA